MSTENSNRASRPCNKTPSADVSSCESVLNGGNESTGCTHHKGAVDSHLYGIFWLVLIVLGRHIESIGLRRSQSVMELSSTLKSSLTPEALLARR
jgi:hypothetical protein